ncbi:carboxyl-terminal processing protease CtpB [Dactylococcopsis salina]|uniref:Carboxyl-terminal-processing protease n=1 Tax=Dactylococcopsis salina (strain PCC 8305) TaxID=13035 RepID=K9YY98_DACS8|nr:carboxyl-terminal processing protease CtpB [Dactylococcopsis salina]AFZ51275.1 C-terminal processing peptidase [Dactylococcopsis salina PCC 8305]
MNQTPFYRIKNYFRSATLAGTIISISWLIPSFTTPASASLSESPKTIVDEVWQLVNENYVDPDFNHDNWEKTREELLDRNYNSKQEAYRAVRNALNKLGDPYTRFLDPEAYQSLKNQTSGELSGVGLRLEINEENQSLTVVEPLENSPASKAGIQPGDEIIAINGQPTSLLSLEQASKLIRGESGTEVNLQLSRTGKGLFSLDLTRAEIELPRVSYELRETNQTRVGYIKVKEFSSHAAEQMREAILDLKEKNPEAYVIDLRNNPGGLLYASIEMARMWLEEGAIVSTVDREGGDRAFQANQTALTDKPLAVLVNGNSASASEILAGALKDNDRAVIVGSKTYGKGTVQSVSSLSDGSGLAVTVARYYPPSGTDINHKGIEPDVKTSLRRSDQVRLSSNPELQGTPQDPQFMSAIDVLRQRLGKTTAEAASF